jgi:LacI family transcriptional regulator
MMEGQPKRPTLTTLAQILGLGVSTVSLALRDSPEIAVATRQRVQLAARQAGYRPNRAGVRLRTGKTNVITVVLNPQDEGSGFFADFVLGISEGLMGTPFHLVVTPYSLADAMEPIRYITETSSADGIIISRTQPDDQRVRFLVDNAIPFVTHGRTDMGLSHPFVDYDNEHYAYAAVRALHERGHRRIAAIGPQPQVTFYQHTTLGLGRALQDFDMSLVPLGPVYITEKMPDIFAAVIAQLGTPASPTAFVCSSLGAAMACAAAGQSKGLLLGKSFDVVTKSPTTMSRFLHPEMICFDEDFRKAGTNLARIVIRAIAGESVDQLQLVTRD